MAGHSTQTRPARIRYHSSELACDVRKVYAYRAECACGWVGPRRDTHREAREDGQRHRFEFEEQAFVSATGGTEAS